MFIRIQASADWKAPWFRLDVFINDVGAMYVNELTYPSHLERPALRDFERWNGILQDIQQKGGGCATPAKAYSCATTKL
jgi:hypothetical protein